MAAMLGPFWTGDATDVVAGPDEAPVLKKSLATPARGLRSSKNPLLLSFLPVGF